MSNHGNKNGGNQPPHAPTNRTPQIEITDNLPKHQLNIGDEGLAVESLVTTEFAREITEEAFANELVVVQLAETTEENANQMPVFTVGEQRQFMPRGTPIGIKRKFLEVIARCKETKYKQVRPDPANPDYQEMQPRTALAYPFSVLHDPNPKGAAWLRAIINEVA